MALIVRLYVNSEHIGTVWARRIKGGMNPDDLNTYELSNGKKIKHRYRDGAVKLTEKIMKNISEAHLQAKDEEK